MSRKAKIKGLVVPAPTAAHEVPAPVAAYAVPAPTAAYSVPAPDMAVRRRVFPFVHIENGEIRAELHLTFGVDTLCRPATTAGARQLGELLSRAGYPGSYRLLFSSSCDFPSEYGGDDNVDYRAAVAAGFVLPVTQAAKKG